MFSLGKVHFWPLEFNEDSFRLSIPSDKITNCFVTPNDEYLAIMFEK